MRLSPWVPSVLRSSRTCILAASLLAVVVAPVQASGSAPASKRYVPRAARPVPTPVTPDSMRIGPIRYGMAWCPPAEHLGAWRGHSIAPFPHRRTGESKREQERRELNRPLTHELWVAPLPPHAEPGVNPVALVPSAPGDTQAIVVELEGRPRAVAVLPRVLNGPSMSCPSGLQGSGLEGTQWMLCHVNPGGHVQELIGPATDPASMDLGRSQRPRSGPEARDAASFMAFQLQFAPGTWNGEPVDMWVQLPLTFVARPEGSR
ncbi:MAG: hypothetical protein ABL977_06890 [Candidatus Eisenbacteria bacterium]